MENYIRHSKFKFHLHNLPVVKCIPKWQGYGDFACLVIPIFSYNKSTKFIEHYIAKTAAWALKTWKENSDAHLFNIPCYIYVEENVADVTLSILKENQVPACNIKVVEYANTEWLAKCLQPIFDPDFQQYEYIVIADLDMFALKSRDGEKLRFFESVRQSKPIGFGCKTFTEQLPTYWTPNIVDFQKYKYNRIIDEKDMIDVWCKTVQSLLNGKSVRKHFDKGHEDNRPWTGIMVAQSDAFKNKTWLEKACHTLPDDESVMYAWSKISEKNRIWDLEEINIDVFVDLIAYIYNAYGIAAVEDSYNEVRFEFMSHRDACLLHHFGSLDYKFYDIIDAVADLEE